MPSWHQKRTKDALVSAPVGVNPVVVVCPSCDAWVGWACGDAHCDGYHRSRIEAATLSAQNTPSRRD